jgi:transglutaminase-like putative cysteine protease
MGTREYFARQTPNSYRRVRRNPLSSPTMNPHIIPRACAFIALNALLAAYSTAHGGALSAPPTSRVYDVQQSVTINEIPKTAKKLAMWISIPDDAAAQRLLDLSVQSAPGKWKIVRDRDRGSRFLYVEVEKPKSDQVTTTVAFSVERSAVQFDLDPAKATPLSDSQKLVFEEELRTNSPHMEVTDEIRKMAKETLGDEKNPVLQATKLLNHVAAVADHYSKNPGVPKCGIGDAKACLAQGGGCCTDLHSLFISLARASGIPARLQMGYRLQPKNVGVEADPGYRCWAEYFLSGYGWVPADIVEADAADPADPAAKARWFSGLTERRVHLNEGRDFDLPNRKNVQRVNHMSIAYAEIDGKPARVLPEGEKQPQITRLVKYTERDSAAAALTPAGR